MTITTTTADETSKKEQQLAKTETVHYSSQNIENNPSPKISNNQSNFSSCP